MKSNSLPVLLLIRVDTREPENEPLNGAENRIQPGAAAGEHSVHVATEPCAGRHGEQDGEGNRHVVGFTDASELFGRIGTGDTHKRCDTQDQR